MWDVSRGQKTEAVTSFLQEQKVMNWYVPKNMTDYFQALDLGKKKSIMDFMKHKINQWSARQLRNELESGRNYKISRSSFFYQQ